MTLKAQIKLIRNYAAGWRIDKEYSTLLTH
jgi:hypothetical protein